MRENICSLMEDSLTAGQKQYKNIFMYTQTEPMTVTKFKFSNIK